MSTEQDHSMKLIMENWNNYRQETKNKDSAAAQPQKLNEVAGWLRRLFMRPKKPPLTKSPVPIPKGVRGPGGVGSRKMVTWATKSGETVGAPLGKYATIRQLYDDALEAITVQGTATANAGVGLNATKMGLVRTSFTKLAGFMEKWGVSKKAVGFTTVFAFGSGLISYYLFTEEGSPWDIPSAAQRGQSGTQPEPTQQTFTYDPTDVADVTPSRNDIETATAMNNATDTTLAALQYAILQFETYEAQCADVVRANLSPEDAAACEKLIGGIIKPGGVIDRALFNAVKKGEMQLDAAKINVQPKKTKSAARTAPEPDEDE